MWTWRTRVVFCNPSLLTLEPTAKYVCVCQTEIIKLEIKFDQKSWESPSIPSPQFYSRPEDQQKKVNCFRLVEFYRENNTLASLDPNGRVFTLIRTKRDGRRFLRCHINVSYMKEFPHKGARQLSERVYQNILDDVKSWHQAKYPIL